MKKSVALLLALLMVFSLLPMTALAEDTEPVEEVAAIEEVTETVPDVEEETPVGELPAEEPAKELAVEPEEDPAEEPEEAPVEELAEEVGELDIEAETEEAELSLDGTAQLTNLSTNYTLTGDMAEDLVRVATAQIGLTGSQIGAKEEWCADFVFSCARAAGIDDSIIPTTGGAGTLYSKIMKTGAQVVTTPQAGDLVFYGGAHVAIMVDSKYSIHGNLAPDQQTYTFYTRSVSKIPYYYYSGNSAKDYIFVRPNYEVVPKDVEINSTNFPNNIFLIFLSENYDTDNDNVLSAAEIANIKVLRLENMGISNLTGIRNFTALEELYCYNNKITSLDLSGLTKLKSLSCNNNEMTELTLSGCTALEVLTCGNNKLTKLDLTGLSSLQVMGCEWNMLETLTLSGCTALKNVICGYNKLTTLDISALSMIEEVDCCDNQLSSLTLGKLPSLKRLSCLNNALKKLDLSGLSALEVLECGGNALTTLDLSKSATLQELICYSNQLTTLDVSKLTKLTRLVCFQNKLTSLTLNGKTLKELECQQNCLKKLDISQTGIQCGALEECFVFPQYDENGNFIKFSVKVSTAQKAPFIQNCQMEPRFVVVVTEWPTEPTELAAPVVTISNDAATGKVKLTWEAVDGAVKYEVWRSTSKSGTYTRLGSTTGTSYINKNGIVDKLYYYKVRAIAADSTAGSYSAVKNRRADCAQPVIKLSNDAATGKVKVTWEAVESAVNYEVWRATSKSGTYTKLSTTTDTSYIDENGVVDKLYYYKVIARGPSSSSDSAYSAVKNRRADCAQPVIKLSNDAATGKVKVTWEAVDGAVKYEVWRSTSKSGTYTRLGSTTGTSYINKNGVVDKLYYYKVIARGPTSNSDSAYSAVKNRRVDCAQPVIKLSNDAATGKVKVTWEAVDSAVNYEVWRATSKSGTYTKLGSATGTSYIDTSCKAGTKYYYKVMAKGASTASDSAYSTIVSITSK